MNKPVIITADSPVDLSKSSAEEYGIHIIPLHITLDGASFCDGVDIFADDLYRFYEEKKMLPKTSSIPIAEYEDFFNSFVSEGYEVVHLSLSSQISSTHNNAVLAAEEFSGVYVLDTLSLSCGMALLALKCCELRNSGVSAAEIYKSVSSQVDKVQVSFILDSLEYMSKGGRCSAVTAFGANILGIRPSLDMNNGTLTISKKYRGRINEAQLQYVTDKLASCKNIDTRRAFLVHTGVDRAQLDLLRKKILGTVPFAELPEAIPSCTITTHCGPYCMGIMFMTE